MSGLMSSSCLMRNRKHALGQIDFLFICDTIKGNESLVENFNSYFVTPLSYNFQMLMHTLLQLYQSYEGFDNVKNNMKQRN